MSPKFRPWLLPLAQSLLLTMEPSLWLSEERSDLYQKAIEKSPVPNCRSSGVPKSTYCSASAPLPAMSSELTIWTALPDTPSTNSGVPTTVPLLLFPELSSAFPLSKDAYSTGAGKSVCAPVSSACAGAGIIPRVRAAASAPPIAFFHTLFIADLSLLFIIFCSPRGLCPCKLA